MNIIQEYLSDEKRQYDANFVKACRYQNILPLVSRLQAIWGIDDDHTSSTTLAFGTGTINMLAINFYLAEEDSMKGPLITRVLQEMLNDEDFWDNPEQNDYTLVEWRAWIFEYKKLSSKFPIGPVKLMLRFWYGKSKSCRLVDSGKTEAVMEVVCE